jgi:hypothetical protein
MPVLAFSGDMAWHDPRTSAGLGPRDSCHGDCCRCCDGTAIATVAIATMAIATAVRAAAALATAAVAVAALALLSWFEPRTAGLVASATAAALAAGFRMFWNSINLGVASQVAMMDAIKASGVPRSELYIAGSVSTLVPGATCNDEQTCYAMAKRQAALQVQLLTYGGVPPDQLMVVDVSPHGLEPNACPTRC